MASVNVYSKLIEFNSRLDESLLLVSDASNFREMRGGHLLQIRSSRVHQITEMAFLGMFLAWEDFLEASFVRFMCGAITQNHYAPRLYVAPMNLEHALKFFIVKPRDYVEWASCQTVIERAVMVFKDGEPYKSAIRPSITELEQMQKVRNAIAHRSVPASTKFETAIRGILGSRPRGLTPGLFLSLIYGDGKSYIEHYKDILSVVASRIVR